MLLARSTRRYGSKNEEENLTRKCVSCDQADSHLDDHRLVLLLRRQLLLEELEQRELWRHRPAEEEAEGERVREGEDARHKPGKLFLKNEIA